MATTVEILVLWLTSVALKNWQTAKFCFIRWNVWFSWFFWSLIHRSFWMSLLQFWSLQSCILYETDEKTGKQNICTENVNICSEKRFKPKILFVFHQFCFDSTIFCYSTSKICKKNESKTFRNTRNCSLGKKNDRWECMVFHDFKISDVWFSMLFDIICQSGRTSTSNCPNFSLSFARLNWFGS